MLNQHILPFHCSKVNMVSFAVLKFQNDLYGLDTEPKILYLILYLNSLADIFASWLWLSILALSYMISIYDIYINWRLPQFLFDNFLLLLFLLFHFSLILMVWALRGATWSPLSELRPEHHSAAINIILIVMHIQQEIQFKESGKYALKTGNYRESEKYNWKNQWNALE